MTDPVFARGFIGQFEGVLLTTPTNTDSIGPMVHYTASARYHNWVPARNLSILSVCCFSMPPPSASYQLTFHVVFVVEHSKNRFSDPKEVVKKLEAVARESYRIRPALAKSLNFGISNHFGQHSGVANLTD